ncbi:MAG: HAD family hydrolase [Nanoarchaeota archaeon]|nr:HAD family hydrolase [Nanoarchaeota archaeon]
MALLIFDMDDTLYKSETLSIVIGDMIAKKFKEVAKVPDHLDAFEEFVKQRKALAQNDEPVSATYLFKKLGVSREEFFKMINDIDPKDHISFDESTQKAIKTLAEDHKLVLLSNSPREKVDKILETLQIVEHFTRIYGADDWHDSKPNADILIRIMEELGYAPEDSFSIGDDLHKEILLPKKLGMKTVLVKHWPYNDEELAHADFVVENVSELPPILKKFINK